MAKTTCPARFASSGAQLLIDNAGHESVEVDDGWHAEFTMNEGWSRQVEPREELRAAIPRRYKKPPRKFFLCKHCGALYSEDLE